MRTRWLRLPGVGIRFNYHKIPFISGARRYAEQFIFPGGTYDNRLYFGSNVHFDPSLDEPSQLLIFDAQTSGGLLLAVPPDRWTSSLPVPLKWINPCG